MKRLIQIDNLKCGSCATTITRSLTQLPGVSNVAVDVKNSSMIFEANDRAFEVVRAKLDQLGYPEIESATGLHAAMATAKSYASCAIGRFGAESVKT